MAQSLVETIEGSKGFCGECGYPSEYGHASNCETHHPAVEAQTKTEFSFEETREPRQVEEYFAMFLRNRFPDMPEQQVNNGATNMTTNFLISAPSRLYLAKDGQKIAGGGAITFDFKNKLAYLSTKAVDKEYQNQGLGQKITEERLGIAKMAGYNTAASFVTKHNLPALRSMMRNGFVLTPHSPDVVALNKGGQPESGMYQLSSDLRTDLDKKKAYTQEELLNTPMAENELRLYGDKVLVYYDDSFLIDTALAKGYIGRCIITEKLPDRTDIKLQAPLILMEKVK